MHKKSPSSTLLLLEEVLIIIIVVMVCVLRIDQCVFCSAFFISGAIAGRAGSFVGIKLRNWARAHYRNKYSRAFCIAFSSKCTLKVAQSFALR